MSKEDLDLIEHPEKWPNWPVLPLKRDGTQGAAPEVGLLLAENKPIVYLANMFDLTSGKTFKEQLAGVNKIEYVNFTALVNDRWMVD